MQEDAVVKWGLVGVALTVVVGTASLFYIGPQYSVWANQMSGKAKLAEAESSRQIATLEAKAKKDSAQYEAEAEIIRAEGAAKANAIIGNSLKGHEAYLRYLWIQNQNKNDKEVIYIPTEAGLPVLEAGKRGSQ